METIVCNASTTCCYLSSSEITKEYANYVYFDKNGGLGLGVSEKYLADAHNHVRPVIAF